MMEIMNHQTADGPIILLRQRTEGMQQGSTGPLSVPDGFGWQGARKSSS